MKNLNILKLTTLLLVVALVASSASTSAVIATAPRSPAEQTGWQLVWSDEFNGPAIDTSNWGYELGYVRNNEQQYYTNRPENARIENGNLLIEARRESYAGYAYTSASLTSQNKRQFQYGRWEMRGRIPTPSGSWPAWWALGSNIDSVGWPKSGEIDMMEYYRSMALFNVMYQNSSGSIIWDSITQTVAPSFGDDYHVWAMEWDTNQIRLYLDGTLKNSFNVGDATVGSYNPFRQPIFMIANLAIGGSNGGDPSGTTFPLRYYVDYIRVYTASTGPTPTPTRTPTRTPTGVGPTATRTRTPTRTSTPGGPTATATRTPTPGGFPVPGAYYRLINRNSNKVADVSGGSTADGADIVQMTSNGQTNQQWSFVSVGSGYYQIVNRKSGKLMDVNGGSTADGGDIIQWPNNSGTNQHWSLTDLGTGYYRITNRKSGKVMDVNGGSTADGGDIIQWTSNGGNNQQWQITP